MVKIALIGCGTMGRTHAGGYLKIKEAAVTAFCDIQEDRAVRLAELHGAVTFTSFEEMMEQGDFDVLDVCLPTYLHKEYAIAAMNKGKHVFCEKPIALTLEDGEAMLEAAAANGVKFSVGHVLRFFPSYRQAQEQIETGRLGVPRLIRTTRNQAFPQWSWENWYQDYEKSGGPIMDLVIHDVDWIIRNVGAVERVFAKSFNGTVAGQEHCILLLRLNNGAIAHVEGSWAYPSGSAFHVTYEIVGTKAQIEFDNLSTSPVVKQTYEEGQHKLEAFSPVEGIAEPYCAELNEFVRSIEYNLPLAVTGQEAIEALKVVLAGIQSSQTGQPVSL